MTGCTSEFGPIAPGKAIPRLTIAPAVGMVGKTADINATVLDRLTGKPLAGQVVTFTVDGSVVGTATSDATGVAKLVYTIPATMTKGNYPVVGSTASTATFEPNSATSNLTVQ